jgi:hypothetical protein
VERFEARFARADPEPRSLESLSCRAVEAAAPATEWVDGAGAHLIAGEPRRNLFARRKAC